jgi:hypothetical protein
MTEKTYQEETSRSADAASAVSDREGGCCGPAVEASCCEPEAKASCCGPEPSTTCGCQ